MPKHFSSKSDQQKSNVGAAARPFRPLTSRLRSLAPPFFFAIALGCQAAESPDPQAQNLLAANDLFTAKKFPEAQTAYEQILARAPHNAEANHRLGLFASSRGDWEKALAFQRAAVDAEPATARYQHEWGEANATAARKGSVFSKISYAKKCLAGFQRAVDLEPANVAFRRSLFDFYFEAPGIAGGSMDKAKLEADQIGKLDAETGRQCLAKILVSKGQHREAFELYDQALKDTPDDYRALYSFGRLALTAGQRFDDGIAALRRCLKVPRPSLAGTPSLAEVHRCCGAIHEKLKQLEEARAEYRAALALQPKFGLAREALRKLEPEQK